MNARRFLDHFSFFVFLMLTLNLLSISELQAQSKQKDKTHYTIINPKNENQDLIIKAITHTDLDPFRFVDKRRLVSIEGTNIQIELFSGNELMDLYGKQISPNNQYSSKKAGIITLKIVHEPTGTKLIQVK